MQLAWPGVARWEGRAWRMTRERNAAQGLSPAHANMVSCSHCQWREGREETGQRGQLQAQPPSPWLRRHHLSAPERDPLGG